MEAKDIENGVFSLSNSMANLSFPLTSFFWMFGLMQLKEIRDLYLARWNSRSQLVDLLPVQQMSWQCY